jgi:hypothetical protein
LKSIDDAHDLDARRRKENNARAVKGWAFTFVGWCVASVLAYVALCETFAFGPVTATVKNHLLPFARQRDHDVFEATLEAFLPDVDSTTGLMKKRWLGVPHGGAYAMLLLAAVLGFVEYVKRATWKFEPTMTKRDAKRMAGYRAYVQELGKVREELYREYFKGLSADRD